MAGVIEAVTGSWGALLLNAGLIISVGSALLAWTLLAAEKPGPSLYSFRVDWMWSGHEYLDDKRKACA
ncbi:hypothetical protein C1886_11555 [Pseudomonas sp. FW300-N1A1]|nr:hypothetical protein C1886_11555 [Pseudomonas sp. FW300-N1A1]